VSNRKGDSANQMVNPTISEAVMMLKRSHFTEDINDDHDVGLIMLLLLLLCSPLCSWR
jgi:hypothetical protein